MKNIIFREEEKELIVDLLEKYHIELQDMFCNIDTTAEKEYIENRIKIVENALIKFNDQQNTLKDLFATNKDYILDIELGNDFHLFVEAEDEFGGSINGNFDIENVKNVFVELLFQDDVICNVYDITIHDTIDYLKKRAMIEIRKGYEEISGLENENEFTDQQMLEYVQDVLWEENQD